MTVSDEYWNWWLRSGKWGDDAAKERDHLRKRLREEKTRLEALKNFTNPVGWIFQQCACGFMITTQPGGKHYCPKCS